MTSRPAERITTQQTETHLRQNTHTAGPVTAGRR